MKINILCLIAFIILYVSGHQGFAQAQNSETEYYSGVFVEYNTLILLTHNIKLYSDLNFYKNEKVILSIQPGAEFILGILGAEHNFYRGNPYYDINLLGAITLFPNYGISIKPFLGISYRFIQNATIKNTSAFVLKYGMTLRLNIYKNFSIIGKVMNMPNDDPNDLSVLYGIGFSLKLF